MTLPALESLLKRARVLHTGILCFDCLRRSPCISQDLLCLRNLSFKSTAEIDRFVLGANDRVFSRHGYSQGEMVLLQTRPIMWFSHRATANWQMTTVCILDTHEIFHEKQVHAANETVTLTLVLQPLIDGQLDMLIPGVDKAGCLRRAGGFKRIAGYCVL